MKTNEKDDKLNNLSFEKTILHFISEEPFYSHFSRYIIKEKTENVDTAAVTFRNGTPVLLYNEDYFYSLCWQHRFGLLQHEILHLVFNHLTYRIKEKDLEIWFEAADFAINSLIKPDFLPPDTLLPGKWPELTEEQKKNMTEDDIQNFQALRSEVLSWPKGESAEWYYERLIRNPRASQALKTMSNKKGRHNTSHKLSKNEQVLADNFDSEGKLEDIVKKCQKTSKWGNVPRTFPSTIGSMVSKKINWRILLRNFIGSFKTNEKYSTIKRINKRYPYVHPGMNKIKMARLAILIDQSLSMTDKHLKMLFGELKNLSNFAEFTLIPFDVKVIESGIKKWYVGDSIKFIRHGHGGTNFENPTKWINKHSSKFDAVIFMTDGQCYKPNTACVIPRLWIITPNYNLFFETDEMVIKMSDDR